MSRVWGCRVLPALAADRNHKLSPRHVVGFVDVSHRDVVLERGGHGTRSDLANLVQGLGFRVHGLGFML